MKESFQSLLSQAERVSYGKDRNHFLEQAIALAEQHSEYGDSYQARLLLCESACFSGQNRLFFDHFFWCLSFFEQYHEEFDASDLLIRFKWALELITTTPFLSKEEIDTLFSTYHSLLLKHEFSLRSYYGLLFFHSLRAGEITKTEHFFLQWQNEVRDSLSDCLACETNLKLTYYLAHHKFDQAFLLADELVATKLVCETVPNTTYAKLLIPFFEKGQTEKATNWHHKGLFFIYGVPLYLEEQANHLMYLTRTDLNEAKLFFDDHVQLSHESDNLYAKFHFYLASLVLAVEAKKQGVVMEMDTDFFIDSVCNIGHAFDKRNQNDYYRQYVLSFLE